VDFRSCLRVVCLVTSPSQTQRLQSRKILYKKIYGIRHVDTRQSFTSSPTVIVKSFASRFKVIQRIKSFVPQLDQYWQQSMCVFCAPHRLPRHFPDDSVAGAIHFSSTTHVYNW
jgi:hypothetical protein